MENLEETKKLRKTHYEKLEKTLENLEQLRNWDWEFETLKKLTMKLTMEQLRETEKSSAKTWKKKLTMKNSLREKLTMKNLKKLWKTWNNWETEKITMKNLEEETHYEKLTVWKTWKKPTMKNSVWKTLKNLEETQKHWKKLWKTREETHSVSLCGEKLSVSASGEETQEFRKAKNSTKLHESRANSRRLSETVLSKSNGTQGKWWKLVQWWNGK